MTDPSRIYAIVGAGGHGREVMPLARASFREQVESRRAELVFVIEGTPPERVVNGHRVLSLDEVSQSPAEKYFSVAIGDSRVRERLSLACLERSMTPVSIFASNALVLDESRIAEGCIVSPFSAITSNVTIGRYFHANNFCNVAHDCVIGDFVTFAPGVRCNGHVHIGDHAYVGSGAVIRNGRAGRPLVVGEGATIGMGAIVTKDVPAGATVVGSPARPMENR